MQQPDSNLTTLVMSRRAHFAMLAEAWLAAGAASFGVWCDGKALAQWPSPSSDAVPTLVAALRVGGRTVGELCVAGLNDATWQARLNADAMLVSQLAAVEDELEGMTAELIDHQDQVLALYDLSQSTRSHLDISETLHSLSREAARLVKAESAALLLQVADHPSTLVQYPPSQVQSEQLVPFLSQLRQRERAVVLNRYTSGIHFPEGIRNLLFVPITIRDSQMAALTLFNKANDGFTAPDMKLASAIADHAGAQIENVLLYQDTLEQAKLRTELDLAASIQLRLLPQYTPKVAGLDVSAASRPALQVGGDFYDFIQRPNRPFVFTVGDVAGKGMSAALLMAMSRTVIANAAKFTPAPTPEGIMSRVNEDLYDDFTEVGMFATAFIAQYNHAQHEISYANAGHSPVIYCSAAGEATMLQADGTAIGVLPMSLCEKQVLSFQPGDVLIVASDGFSEARNPHEEMFGYDRLLRLAENVREQSAQAIRNAFFGAVEHFSAGHAQDDDQTLVVVKGVAA